MLDLARRHDIWIIADEIYGRFVYDPALTIAGRTPSFRDVMTPEDRILFVQTFSKNWAMTGWRLGWLEASPRLGQVIENLVQYQTSGTPVFVQRGRRCGHRGRRGIRGASDRTGAARPRRSSRLTESGLVDLPPPSGAFYAFLKIKGAARVL